MPGELRGLFFSPCPGNHMIIYHMIIWSYDRWLSWQFSPYPQMEPNNRKSLQCLSNIFSGKESIEQCKKLYSSFSFLHSRTFLKVNLGLWEAKKAVSSEQDAVRFWSFCHKKHRKGAKLPWRHNIKPSFWSLSIIFLSFSLFILLSFCIFVFSSFCLIDLLSFCLFICLSFFIFVFL